ncbi:hypothetical protein AWB77_06088 [Caballeronia fortuita]|uniref:Uncharacterized protein n=1 Tax=Caballeronia fortuita TaxID=1777138 RepID=A0A158E122_9BURK|nr:hypothetical protein AWB77_06088 [Caballeronia fortuita]
MRSNSTRDNARLGYTRSRKPHCRSGRASARHRGIVVEARILARIFDDEHVLGRQCVRADSQIPRCLARAYADSRLEPQTTVVHERDERHRHSKHVRKQARETIECRSVRPRTTGSRGRASAANAARVSAQVNMTPATVFSATSWISPTRLPSLVRMTPVVNAAAGFCEDDARSVDAECHVVES